MKTSVNKGILLVLVVICCLGLGSTDRCNTREFECNDGTCIDNWGWCDGFEDCDDKTDEKYCTHSNPKLACPSDYFTCDDGGCIPLKGHCDGTYSCSDFSDENNCRSIEIEDAVPSHYTTSQSVKPLQTLDWHRNLAESFILSQRKDFSWDMNTPYAILALYFSNPNYFRNGSRDVVLMKKKLEFQLLLELHGNQTRQMPLSTLSTYIAALQATCQDPRNFNDLNLLEILRYKAAVSNKPVNPFVYLILCLFGEASHSDLNKIRELFTPSSNRHSSEPKLDRLEFQAVAHVAASCIERSFNMTNYMVDRITIPVLLPKFEKMGPGNAYELALALDAMNEINNSSKDWIARKSRILASLLYLQQQDGSFGDIRATYYAMPLLSGNSFQSLRHSCQKPGSLVSSKPTGERKIDVKYSLYIGSSQEVSYTLQMKVLNNLSFLLLMEAAQQKNPFFTFKYDIDNDNRPSVYSIAFVPNDVERETYWKLYKENVFRKDGLHPLNQDISDLRVNHGDHFVYWYQRM